MSRPEKGSEVEVLVDSLAFGGRGVARLDDFVLFVDRALPGDRVRARVTKVKRAYGEASTVETLEPGPDRVDAPCPHFGACGGCRWQDLDYERAAERKAPQVRRRAGAHRPPGRLRARTRSSRAIRTTTTATSSSSRSDATAPRARRSGFHRAGRWDEIMPLTACLLMAEAGNEARRGVEAWARAAGAAPGTGAATRATCATSWCAGPTAPASCC